MTIQQLDAIPSRFRLVALCLLCTILLPIVLFFIWGQAIIGNKERALNSLAGLDETVNALFGGPEWQTISARTGIEFNSGVKWAKYAEPFIDFLFYKGHCQDAATQYLQRVDK